jgi:hypothetical protein
MLMLDRRMLLCAGSAAGGAAALATTTTVPAFAHAPQAGGKAQPSTTLADSWRHGIPKSVFL